jgi:DNA-binding LytR/AlgR family response regulator
MEIDPQPEGGLKDKISCFSKGKVQFIYYRDILYVAAAGSYSKVFCKNKPPVTISKSMGSLLKKLPENQFMRCHRSHVINVEEIEEIDTGSNRIMMSNNDIVPISSRKHRSFLSKFRIWCIF